MQISKASRWVGMRRFVLEERPFTSNAPIIGALIARFRELWNNVATKWYVRPLLSQQNQINKQANNRLHHLESNFINMDREQSHLIHDISELTAQIVQTNQLLQSIDDRLAALEDNQAQISRSQPTIT